MNPNQPADPSQSETITPSELERKIKALIYDAWELSQHDQFVAYDQSSVVAKAILKLLPDTRHSVNGKLMTAEEIAGELENLRIEKIGQESEIYIGGVWRCPQCSFECIKSFLYVKSGGIGPNLEKSELCPNDGASMVRVSYKERVRDYDIELGKQIERALTAESALADAKKSLELADELAFFIRSHHTAHFNAREKSEAYLTSRQSSSTKKAQ